MLEKIVDALRPSCNSTDKERQRRYVITGLGGQGKSEVCLKVANLVREAYVNSTFRRQRYLNPLTLAAFGVSFGSMLVVIR